MKCIKTHNQGFTLAETLIALGIMVSAGLSVFTLFQQTLLSARISKETIIATSLAREGLELVRSLRDTPVSGFDFGNSSLNNDWVMDTSANYNFNTPADNADITLCNNCQMYYKDGKYGHDATGTQVPFKRMVTLADGSHVTCAGAGVCEKVVTVSVLRAGSNNLYTIVEYITDWR